MKLLQNNNSLDGILADFTTLESRLADFVKHRADEVNQLRIHAAEISVSADVAASEAQRAEAIRGRILEILK